LIISLTYSCRRNMTLCRNSLNFLTTLLEHDIVKIEFVIIKAGLLQVLINLLRFYSDSSQNTSCYWAEKEKNQSKMNSAVDDQKAYSNDLAIIDDLKRFFWLITKLLLRFNENQDIDNFSCFLNTLISLCFDSANIGLFEILF
jgi:hypothetical protein